MNLNLYLWLEAPGSRRSVRFAQSLQDLSFSSFRCRPRR